MKLVMSIWVIFLVLGTEISHADRLLSLYIPKEPEMKLSASEIAGYLERYKEHDGVILLSELSIEHSGSHARWPKQDYVFKLGDWWQNWQYTIISKQITLVINPRDTFLTIYETDFKYDKLYFQVVYPDGQAMHYSFSDMRKVKKPNGTKTYHIEFQNVTPGTIIIRGLENNWSENSASLPLDEDLFLQYYLPYEQLKLSYLYPDWWKVNIKRNDSNEIVPLVSTHDTAGHRIILSYSAQDVPAFPFEPFSISWASHAKRFALMITDIKMEHLTETYGKSWDSLLHEFNKTLLTDLADRSKKMEQLVDSLVNPGDPPLTQINSILLYLHRTIKYAPEKNKAGADQILRRKTGSMYAVTWLALSMLRYAGFTVDGLLVHDGYEGYFDPLYINFSQIDIPALRVMVENQPIVLFPGFRYYPAPVIPPRYQEQQALVLNMNQEAEFWKLPADSTIFSTYVDTYTVSLDSAGGLNILHTESRDGTEGYYLRWLLSGLDKKERENSLAERVTYQEKKFTVHSATVINDTVLTMPPTIAYNFTVHDAVIQTPNEMIIQTTDLFPFDDNDPLVDAEKRMSDIYISSDMTFDRKVLFIIPNGWELQTLPVSERVETDLGTATSQWAAVPNGIQIHQVITLKQTKQPKEKYPDLLALMGRNAKTAIPALVLTKTPE